MKISRDSLFTLITFFVLTVGFYFLGYWLIYRLAKATPLMLSVGVAALFTCYLRNIKLSSLGWEWGESKYQALSYLVPLGFIATAYAVICLFGLGEWYNTDFLIAQKQAYNLTEWSNLGILIFHFLITATITFILTLPSVLGEEVAWRGLLVSELAKSMRFTKVALVSGIIWSVFHYPLIILGLYGNSITPLAYQLLMFTLYLMGWSMIMTYLRYKTNSLWTAVIFHASGNIFMQKFFNPLLVENPNAPWVADEFGAVPAIVVVIFAFYFWRKGTHEFQNGLGIYSTAKRES